MSKIESIAIFLLFLFVILKAGAEGIVSQDTAVEIAAKHIHKACAAVWVDTSEYKVDRCVVRAMSALNPTNRLRDNELKALLMESEKALEKCQGGRDGSKS